MRIILKQNCHFAKKPCKQMAYYQAEQAAQVAVEKKPLPGICFTCDAHCARVPFKHLDCRVRDRPVEYYCGPSCWMEHYGRVHEDVSWDSVSAWFEQAVTKGIMTPDSVVKHKAMYKH